MRRLLTFLTAPLAAAVCLVLPTMPGAMAQSVDDIVESVDFRGYYADASAEGVDINELERTMARLDDSVALVVLARDPTDGADLVADRVRAEFERDLSVLVITPSEVGATSDVADDAEVGAALDAVLDDLDAGRSVAVAAETFATALDADDPPVDAAPQASPGADVVARDDRAASSSSGGGGRGLLIFLAVVAVVIVGGYLLVKRRARKVDDADVQTARAEIRAQLGVVAAEILDNEGRVEVSGNTRAIEYFRNANATYNKVSELVETTTNLHELAGLNDEIDHARWELDAAEALMEGRTPPPAPQPDQPAACFFDPTHRAGTEAAVIKTSAGEKEVRVCRACADKLERGERPEPRMIDVGGRRVPAAAAPRSHGGLGMGGLSIFEIVLGALGALGGARGSRPAGGLGIDWGGMLGGRSGSSRSSRVPTSRASSSPFGIDRLPSRPRGLPTTRSSRPTSSRGGTGGSKGPARGRARRRR